MSGWIKIDKDLSESLRFKRVVRKLRENSNALRGVTSHVTATTIVLGALARLWMHADTHVQNDDVLEATTDEIDELVGVDGFAAALPADWLQVVDPEHVKLPDFLAHNGGSARERKQSAKRQAAYRSRKQARNVTQSNALRDEPRPDQTRPEETRPEFKRVPSEPVEPERSTVADDPASRVFDHWREVHRHPHAQLDAKRRKLITASLKHYSEAELCQAISGYRNSPHHMGQNDRATMYDDIGLILRDATHIDAGLRFYAEPPRTDLSPQTRRIISQTEDWQPPEVRHANR